MTTLSLARKWARAVARVNKEHKETLRRRGREAPTLTTWEGCPDHSERVARCRRSIAEAMKRRDYPRAGALDESLLTEIRSCSKCSNNYNAWARRSGVHLLKPFKYFTRP